MIRRQVVDPIHVEVCEQSQKYKFEGSAIYRFFSLDESKSSARLNSNLSSTIPSVSRVGYQTCHTYQIDCGCE